MVHFATCYKTHARYWQRSMRCCRCTFFGHERTPVFRLWGYIVDFGLQCNSDILYADQETVQVSDSVPDPKLRPYVYIDDTISGAKGVYAAKGICCRRL